MKQFRQLLSTIRALFEVEVLPDIQIYDLGARPQRNVKSAKSQAPIKGQVYNGKEAKDVPLEDGTIETVYGNPTPKLASEVVLDGYDMAWLDAEVGVKWRADDGLAKVMKWHWLAERSAKKIEDYHRSNSSGGLPSGYSTRNAAKFIKAFYLADDQREEDGKPRQRRPKDSNGGGAQPKSNANEVDLSSVPLSIDGLD